MASIAADRPSGGVRDPAQAHGPDRGGDARERPEEQGREPSDSCHRDDGCDGKSQRGEQPTVAGDEVAGVRGHVPIVAGAGRGQIHRGMYLVSRLSESN